MADIASPLDDLRVGGRFGSGESLAVALSEVRSFDLFQLAAWPETVAKVGALGARTLGVARPSGPGEALAGDKGTLLRVDPLKWWLVAEGHRNDATPVLSPEDGSFLDLSHARTWLKVGGDKAGTLLNHFLPIDLRERSFPRGSLASTAFHHVGVTLWRSESGFNLLLPASFAASLYQMLQESALQYGLEVL